MRIDVARQSLGQILSQCVILMGLFSARFFMAPDTIETASVSMPLGDWVSGVAANFPVLGCVLSVLIVLFSAVYITRIISAKLVLPARNYLASIFYIMISCGIIFPCRDISAVLACYLTIRATAYFIGSFKRSYNFGRIFSASSMLGIAALLTPLSVIMLVLAPVSMGIFRRSGRETIVALLGVAMPVLLYSYIVWFMGEDFGYVFSQTGRLLAESAGWVWPVDILGWARLATFGLFSLMIFLSLVNFRKSSSDMRTTAYKVFIYMMCLLALNVVAFTIFGLGTATILFFAIPASFLIPLLFAKNRGPFPAVLYCLGLGAVILLNVYQLI